MAETAVKNFPWADYPESAPCRDCLAPFLRYLLDRHRDADGVTEVRLIRDNPKVVTTGYFTPDEHDALIELLAPPPGGPRAKVPFGEPPRIGEANAYYTLNPVVPAAYARSAGVFTSGKHTTGDADVLGVSMVPLDFDPVRLSGVSATDGERAAAKEVAVRANAWLCERGIVPIIVMSGNGYHLLIPTPVYPNTPETTERVKRFLRLMRDESGTTEVDVDQTVFNPGRIMKLPGSVAMKGSNTPDRPHRFAKLVRDPSDCPDVDLFALLRDELSGAVTVAPAAKTANTSAKNAAVNTAATPAASGPERDRSAARLEAALVASNLEYRAKDKKGDRLFEFHTCPHHTDPDGHTYECCVIVRADGRYAAKCQHDPAAGWQHFKKLLPWQTDGAPAASRPSDPGDDPPPAAPRYGSTPEGLVHYRPGRGGEPVPTLLTNFTATIVAEVVRDDGQETNRALKLEAAYPGRTATFTLPTADFALMNWPLSHVGAGAIVYPGMNNNQHARTAIQQISGTPPVVTVYTHTGWSVDGGRHVYLHAGGAIGAGGPVPGVRVELEPALSRYRLPDPPAEADLPALIRRTLKLRDLTPPGVFFPLFAANFRTALAGPDFSLFLFGPTGAFKTAVAALVAQFFGVELSARSLPASWSSTANSNEALAFLAKDAVLVVDDFVPLGGTAEVLRLNRDADRLLRGQGNASGRGRMRADATLRPGRPPRGMILSTGEELPRGHSLRARLLALELRPGTVNAQRLTHRQRDAADGVYAALMAGFVRWLAPRRADVLAALPGKITAYRNAAAEGGQHGRTPTIVADLYAGAELFAEFAGAAGAFTAADAEAFLAAAWEGIGDAAARQGELHADADPADRYVALLAAGVATGQCHLASAGGGVPMNAPAWGWRPGRGEQHEPQGVCVGWVHGADVYLQPESAHAFAQRMADAGGEPLTAAIKTVHKRLHERKRLKSVDEQRDRLVVRKQFHGHKRTVLHLDAALFGRPVPTPAPPATPPAE